MRSGVTHTRASRGDVEEHVDATVAIAKDDAEMQATVRRVQRVVKFKGSGSSSRVSGQLGHPEFPRWRSG